MPSSRLSSAVAAGATTAAAIIIGFAVIVTILVAVSLRENISEVRSPGFNGEKEREVIFFFFFRNGEKEWKALVANARYLKITCQRKSYFAVFKFLFVFTRFIFGRFDQSINSVASK